MKGDKKAGFSRVDLLVVIGVGVTVTGLALPTLGSGRSKTNAVTCANNARALISAWTSFAADNGGSLVGVVHGGLSMPAPVGTTPQTSRWAQGWLDWTGSAQNTNVALVTARNYSSLAPYYAGGRNPTACPADRFISESQRNLGWSGRVRSFSGNIAVGPGNGGPGDGPWNAAYLKARKLSEVNPSTVVYLEEHPDSMNDVAFFPPSGLPGSLNWLDLPGSFHNGGGMLCFGDGSAGVRRWGRPVDTIPVSFGAYPAGELGNNQVDLKFLFDRTPHAATVP